MFNSPVRLTHDGIDWIRKYGVPVMAVDFVGYLIRVTEKESCFVGFNNLIIPVSTDKRHIKMTKRRIGRVFDVLHKAHFIEDSSDDPFPEFAPEVVSDFAAERAVKIDRYLLSPKFEIVPDDTEINIDWL